MLQTVEQKRANYAYEKIKAVKGKKFEKKFSSLIGRLATLILTNGLGNTIAFLLAKGKEEHHEVVYILSEWLINNSELGKKNIKIDSLNKKENQEQIINSLITKATVEEYIYYTEESLRLTNWLRRFSDALLEKGEENE